MTTGSSARSIALTPELESYIATTWVHEPDAAAALRQATASMSNRGMQIGPDQGRLLYWLASTIGARRCLEIGVFTGYSSLWTALALPDDGQLVSCDISAEWTSIGRPHWEQAGVADRIDLRIGPADQTLAGLLEDGQADSFDMAFIDADKANYDVYYEHCLRLVRIGGVIAIDNVLWSGDVARSEPNDANTSALRALNAKVGTDRRVSASLVPIGDGLTLARRIA